MADFVEVDVRNDKAFSNEYAKLLLLIGSEVDVVAKQLCNKIGTAKAENIDDYRKVIVGCFPGMETIEIEMSRYDRVVQPWLSWASNSAKSPDWWRAYNAVKHERDKNFAEANQINSLSALCGLLALLLYYYKDNDHLQPYPKLLEYGFPSYLVTEGGKKLPGT